jgi:hypothetical protein
MANKPYENFVLANEVEDQYNSHLDLLRFCTIDNSLVGTAGMKKIIHVYSATNGTEKLAQGQGNTKNIEASYEEKEYEILLAQNRFAFYDEEFKKDPLLIDTGTKHAGVDIYNTVQGDVYAAFKTATLEVTPSAYNFDAFVDAVAKLNIEQPEGVEIFGFVAQDDMAAVRKSLKETLQYVEAFARQGYVGTVAGVNLYVKNDATAGEVVIGTKAAVTLFNKTGVEVEDDRDPNTRHNEIYSRKYYFSALTDATKAVKIKKTA